MKRIAFILFILIASVQTFAQTANEIVKTKYIFDNKIPSVIDIEQSESNKRDINDGKSYLEQLLQLNKETTAKLIDTYADSIGGYHEIYKEYYKGVEVDGSKYALHYNKEGSIYRASGCFWTVESLNTVPQISEQEALLSAKKQIGAEKYAWEDKYNGKFEKNACCDISATCYPRGKLLVHIKDNTPYLTYQFNISAVIPTIHCNVYVDAISSKIVDKYNTTCEVEAIVNTNYSGNNKTIQTSYDSEEAQGYVLCDSTRGTLIKTRPYNFPYYVSIDNTWNNLSQYDRNAIDVHWGTEMAYDFYLNKFYRNSIDGNGGSLVSFVNSQIYNNASFNYGNGAYFIYGFKNYDLTKPYVSFDVIAHEYTHGVTYFSSQLANIDESAAINEGMSDIFAVSMEYWAQPYKTDASNWQIGEDVYTLRDLANPNCKYYTGNGWDFVNAEPHNNSGVFSYWCYLLTHGGTNNDPNINVPVLVNSINMDKAIRICYDTNINKLSSYSNYAYLAESTYESALELGYGSIVANEVRNAWYNVGVMSLNDILSISGPCLVDNCSMYYIENLPEGCSVTWSLSDSVYNKSMCMIQDKPYNQCLLLNDKHRVLNNATLTAVVRYGGKIQTILTKKGIKSNTIDRGSETSPALTVKIVNRQIDISIDSDSEPLRSVKIDDNEQVWILDVVNGITGEKISTKSINKSFCSIDADDWVPGIYIINASIDGKMLSKKVILK